MTQSEDKRPTPPHRLLQDKPEGSRETVEHELARQPDDNEDPLDRFDKRQQPDGRWEVFNSRSGEVVVTDGLPLSDLGAAEADDAVRGLLEGRVSPDS